MTRLAPVSREELVRKLRKLGFDERSKGSHFIYRQAGIEERVNLQRDGRHAKPYQVRQVRAVIVKYRLGGG
jgi:predicted RNA binding protein YcfA (HicA-like mRNA interferase family)